MQMSKSTESIAGLETLLTKQSIAEEERKLSVHEVEVLTKALEALKEETLESLFEKQRLLNEATFAKTGAEHNGFSFAEFGLELKLEGDAPGPNSLVNKWLRKYLEALDDESRELREELHWKWWSKDRLNMQNIRVEIIDQLHFWMSLAMVSGMDAVDVLRIYNAKNAVNLERIVSGYSKATKDEADNKGIA